jgi:hypothetical protein
VIGDLAKYVISPSQIIKRISQKHPSRYKQLTGTVVFLVGKEGAAMKLGPGDLNKSPTINLKSSATHQDSMPKRKHWNPWEMAKNLTKVIIVAGVVIVLVKVIINAVTSS